MKSSLQYPPGALPTRSAYEYAGGRVVFEALREAFPELVSPVYVSRKLTVYRREALDQALAAVALTGKPLSPVHCDGRSTDTTQRSGDE